MSDSRRTPRVIAVVSGKGGVGKSLVAANIAVFLATLSKKVVAIDGSFGSSNLHSLVGVHKPRSVLSDVLRRSGRRLDEVLEPTSVPGLELASGHSDPPWAANPRPGQIVRLSEQIAALDADYAVLDLGSGTGSAGLDLAEVADEVIVVLTPEPTSIELGYRWMCTALLRRIAAGEGGAEARALIREHFATPIPAPMDLYRLAESEDPAIAEVVRAAIAGFKPGILVNCARSKADIDLGLALTSAARRRLGLRVHYLGHLEYDDAVWVSLRHRRPLLIEHPEARVSKCIEKVTRRLMSKRSAPSFAELAAAPNYYELLEVEPGATEEEIRRSVRRLRGIYAPESVVVAGLYDNAELEELHRHFDRAHDVLMDPLRRKEYDQQLFPDGVPVQSKAFAPTLPAAAPPPDERPPMPELGDDVEITGALLRQVREARGLDLREISEHTKIGMVYLDAIENDIYGKLPAAVYVRGFLTEYAKMLGLEVHRIVDPYLERYRAAETLPA